MNYCGVEKFCSTVNEFDATTCNDVPLEPISNVIKDTRANLEDIWNLLDVFDKFSFNTDNRADAFKEVTSDSMEHAIRLNRDISFAIKDKLSIILDRYGC